MEHHTLNPENWNIAHRDYLLQFALSRVSDYGTAEDLVQDAFLSGWSARSRFRGECTEKTWLTGILRNKIIDHYRRSGRRPSVLATDLDSGLEGREPASWMDRQPDRRGLGQPEVSTARHEFLKELDQAIRALPETMARAFRMREIDGCSTEEITRELNISKANLWVLIHRAKQGLSQSLKGNWSARECFGESEASS